MIFEARHDRLRFVVPQCTVGDDAHFRLTRDIEIRAREMKPFEQRVAAATLLMRRPGQVMAFTGSEDGENEEKNERRVRPLAALG
jgi:hypothetical protein